MALTANENILLIQTHSWVAISSAKYSASVADVATTAYFSDFHKIAAPAAINTNPENDFRLVLQPVQSASQYPADVSLQFCLLKKIHELMTLC